MNADFKIRSLQDEMIMPFSEDSTSADTGIQS